MKLHEILHPLGLLIFEIDESCKKWSEHENCKSKFYCSAFPLLGHGAPEKVRGKRKFPQGVFLNFHHEGVVGSLHRNNMKCASRRDESNETKIIEIGLKLSELESSD